MDTADQAELCFPLLANSSCRKPLSPQLSVLLVHVLLSLVSLLTAALNMLVIVSIAHFRQLQSPTNLLLVSLAASDLLVGLLLMPAEIISTTVCWFLGDVCCALYYVVDFIISSSSVGNVVLISVDRYLAICHPLRYPARVTLDRTRVWICLCWICSSAYAAAFVLTNSLRPSDRRASCRGECALVVNDAAFAADSVFNLGAPITVVIVLYLRVFAAAASQARAVRSHAAARRRSSTINKSELKAAKTLGVVVVVFVLCLCPYYVPSFRGEGVEEKTSAAPFTHWLLYLNSGLNPLIYAMFYPWFRESARLIVTLQILKPNSRHANIA